MNYNSEQIAELIKCRDDVEYFADNYIKFSKPNGVVQAKLNDFQRSVIRNYRDNKVSEAGNISILQFIEDNCIALKINGNKLDIQPCKWLTGLGTQAGSPAAGTDRMICYSLGNYLTGLILHN